MTYEIGQLDIPDRQLLPGNAHSRASKFTEIGEAIVTHTIFGRAKVRIVHKHDKMRRILWMVALSGVAVAAAAAWQGWMAAQQAEPVQSAAPAPVPGTNLQESAPAPLPENIAQPPVEGKPATPQTGIDDAPLSQKPAPQRAQALPNAGQQQVKPVMVQPSLAGKPQTPPAANDIPARNLADAQQPPAAAQPKQPVPPTVAKPRVMQSVTQSAASSPAAAIPLTPPLLKEDAKLQAPAGNKQAAEPVNVQP